MVHLCVCVLSHSIIDPMDSNPPGSSVGGIFSGKNIGAVCPFLVPRYLPESGIESMSLASPALASESESQSSCPTLCDPIGTWNSPGQNTGVGSLSLLQGIFPTQGSNPGLPHRRRILYQLSHQGSLRILEWVAYPFSSRSS